MNEKMDKNPILKEKEKKNLLDLENMFVKIMINALVKFSQKP